MSNQKAIYQFKTSDGLQVNLIQKKGYHQYLGALSVKFGAVTNCFYDENGNKINVPEGTAHFLEHKVFDKKEGDALVRFTNLGADANAFTGSNQTTYYFTATSNLSENLDWLLTFVQSPYFTEEKVDRERGIIGEEIKLYQDDPYWQLYSGVTDLLYPDSALSQDIAGTQESLKKITAGMLYQIQAAFYQPTNMQLTVVGDFDLASIQSLIEETQKKFHNHYKKVVVPDEKLRPQSDFDRVVNYPVTVPKAAFGIRLPENKTDLSNENRVKKILLSEMCLDLVFGDQTDWFQKCYQEGIFGDDFDYEYSNFGPYQYLTFYTEGKNNNVTQLELEKRLAESVKVIQNSEVEFTQLKNAVSGEMLASENKPEALGLDEDAVLYGISLFDRIDLITSFTFEDVISCGKNIFDGSRLSRLILEK